MRVAVPTGELVERLACQYQRGNRVALLAGRLTELAHGTQRRGVPGPEDRAETVDDRLLQRPRADVVAGLTHVDGDARLGDQRLLVVTSEQPGLQGVRVLVQFQRTLELTDQPQAHPEVVGPVQRGGIVLAEGTAGPVVGRLVQLGPGGEVPWTRRTAASRFRVSSASSRVSSRSAGAVRA